MNWIDVIVLLIIIYSIGKGLSLGFVLSIFSLIRVFLSVVITRRYYSYVYGYILENPSIYNIFKRIASAFSASTIISDILLKVLITVFSMIFIFFLSNVIINLILQVFSFLLSIPVIQELNQIGGIVFGLIKGLFLVYLFNLLLSPIVSIYSTSFIGRGVLNSFTYNYLKGLSPMSNLIFQIKQLI